MQWAFQRELDLFKRSKVPPTAVVENDSKLREGFGKDGAKLEVLIRKLKYLTSDSAGSDTVNQFREDSPIASYLYICQPTIMSNKHTAITT